MKKSFEFSVKPGCGYAFEFGDALCHWVEPDKYRLTAEGRKPTPEAKTVAVKIVKRSDYRRMMKLIKGEANV